MSELDTWKQLAEDAARGNLTLNMRREDLDAALGHLQTYIHHVDGLHRTAKTVATVAGFGGFQIGEALAAKFTDKGSGAESISQRLTELVTEAQAIADTLRKVAAALTESDQQAADALRKGTQS